MSSVMAGYRNSGFFVMRTPLLPLDEFLRLSEGIEPNHGGEPEVTHTNISQARQPIRERMRRLLRMPEVREAILLASPSLEEQLAGWLDNPNHTKSRDTELALYRYLARMCTRPTPFGLFAGLSLGELRAETHIRLQGREQYIRYTRLDNDYLHMLLQQINDTPQFRASAVFFPNSSLYPQAGAFRYVESSVDPKFRAKSYQLVSAQHNEYLALILERARDGATHRQLAQAIVERYSDFSLAEASEYIDTLIDNQLLVSPLDVAVTGQEPLDSAIADLQGKAPDTLVGLLGGIRDRLSELDQAGMTNPRERYEAIARELEALPPKDVKLSRLFQVNLRKPVESASLGKDVVVAVRASLETLYRIAAPPEDGIIEEFKQRFMERYEGRPVPLLEALDEETGIGVEGRSVNADVAPLLEGLDFASTERSGQVNWRHKEQWLLDKLQGIWETGAEELKLSPEDIRELEVKQKPPLPPAFSVTFHIATGKAGKEEILLDGAGGPSGINLLGRFCHESPELTQWVKRHLAEEEATQPDALFAEIVHLPEGRIGNVICRPVFREYEIPYLGRSGVEPAKQIPVSDLLVSVVNGRLILTSRRLGHKVIPRLSNSHNIYSAGLGVYRFLANLQHHAHTWRLGWDWGPLANASRLPRVRIGSVLVARQQWTLPRTDLTALAKSKSGKRLKQACQLRDRYRMARFVAFVEGDNALAVDFANIVSLDAMLDVAKRRPSARFVELWPGDFGEGSVRGPEGSFANEFVLPFVKQPDREVQTASKSQSVRQRPDKQIRRSFPPGSEWLYLKLYAGESVIDPLLTDAFAEPLQQFKAEGLIDRWFFIRYGDPDWHLRLRLHGEPDGLNCQVLRTLSDLANEFIGDGLLSRFVVDTYDRELERYGGAHGIEASEQLFCIDSETVLRILTEVLPEGGEEVRWQLALMGADRLLDDFGFDLVDKAAFMTRRRRGYAAEFSLMKLQEKQLSKKYREAREGVEFLLTGTYTEEPLRLGAEILDERSRRLAPLAQSLRMGVREKRIPNPIEELVASYIHMYTNRLLRSAARAQELVLYDYLARAYRSQRGRSA